MINLMNTYREYKSEALYVGKKRALKSLFVRALNKIINIRRFEIILLKREDLVPIDPKKYSNVYSRLATQEDLNKMSAEGKWQMTDELKESFKDGDFCLLSFIDNKLAGYTWMHSDGHPRLISGLRIKVPNNYGYNYAGFTLPEFRGNGLQPYRHHEILNRPEWKEKRGMIGYVDAINWSSKNGQTKSGFQRMGDLMLLGSGESLKVIFSRELKKMGIARLED